MYEIFIDQLVKILKQIDFRSIKFEKINNFLKKQQTKIKIILIKHKKHKKTKQIMFQSEQSKYCSIKQKFAQLRPYDTHSYSHDAITSDIHTLMHTYTSTTHAYYKYPKNFIKLFLNLFINYYQFAQSYLNTNLFELTISILFYMYLLSYILYFYILRHSKFNLIITSEIYKNNNNPIIPFASYHQHHQQSIGSTHMNNAKVILADCAQLDQYFMIKRTTQLPAKITILFSILEKAVEHPQQCTLQSGRENNKNRTFLHAFSKMAIDQQAKFMSACIQFVVKFVMKKSGQVIEQPISQIHKIETTTQMYSTYLKIPVWNEYSFKLDKNKKIILLSNKKKSETIDLHFYLVRRSKKFKGCIVLQNTQQNWGHKKIVLSFQEYLYQKIYDQLFQTVIKAKQQQLENILKNNEEQNPQQNGDIENNIDNKKNPQNTGQLSQLHSQPQSQNSQHNNNNNSNMVFLSSKNINDFLNYKQSILKHLLTGKQQQYKKISSEQRKQFHIDQNIKNQRLFKLQGLLNVSNKVAKINLLNNFGNLKNKLIVSSQVLQNFSGKYSAVYEKYLFSTKIQQLITIRQQNLTADQQDVLFVKGMQNIMIKNFIQFLFVKIKPISPQTLSPSPQQQSKLFIFCSIVLNQTITADKVKFYLLTLYENCLQNKTQKMIKISSMNSIKQVNQQQNHNQFNRSAQIQQKDREKGDNSLDQKYKTIKLAKSQQKQLKPNRKYMESAQQKQQLNDQQFKTVYGELFGQQQYVQFVEGDQKQKQYEIKDINEDKIKHDHKSNTNHLNYNVRLSPMENYDKKQHLMTTHYLFTDWVRRKQGGVICKNQEIINNQKRLFKDLIARLGSNILKGGTGVLNISLPVIVLKKQSHLYSIARDFCYAPLFFQSINQASSFSIALQRVKKAALLAISVGTLGISMQKPFNPLLGQTLQVWIGGCPMYLEQISHHPPIGSYYFVGRGYRIYGQIQPRISFGMNNVKGYSERPNVLKFDDDGTEIQMAYGKMIIHGLLFGEREFNFQDKIFAYDKKNHLFAQIFYGPRKKSMLKKSQQPSDLCYGKIYLLKEQFLQLFNNSKPRIYPTKDHIIKQVSTFEGIWNEVISFDGQQYINFKTMMPCEIEQELYPLPSNSHYRMDLMKLIEGDLEESQEQKQIIEGIQRRDRKLREKHEQIYQHQPKLKKASTK